AARVPAEATAYAHRSAPILFAYLAMDGGAEAAARNDRWAAEGIAALGRDATAGTYVNFQAEQGADSPGKVYPEASLNRLRDINNAYVHASVYRLKQNIPPAA